MSATRPHHPRPRHATPRLTTPPRRDRDGDRAPLQLAPSARALAPSPTLEINEAIARRRAAGRDIIHLGFGEASVPLHPTLRAALGAYARATSYAPVLGLPALRQAIAAYLARERALAADPDRVAVAPGSKPLLYAIVQSLAGDVLLPVPSWVSYAPHARLAGRRVIPVATDPADHHRLTPDALAAATARARHAGADPRILIVNTPSNPTGGMLARDDVEALAAWARRTGVTILSDEIYAELAHGWRAHVSPAAFYPEGTIVTGGLSKGFAAGGWRLGYALFPDSPAGRQLLSAVRALASEIWSSAATPVQEAAITAFAPDDEIHAYVRRAARLYAHATGRLHATLTRLAVPCPRPAAAFYLYPDFAPWRAPLAARGVTTSADLARLLLDEHDIATLPGAAFGEEPDVLRLRLATSLLFRAAGAAATQPAADRDTHLWALLERTGTLPDDDPAAGDPLPLPELDRAEQRFAAFVASLGNPARA